MNFGCLSGKTFRFFIGHHRGRPGSDRYRHGFQFQRGVCHGKIQRLLLFSQTAGSLVSSGDRSSARGKKPELPQIAPAHLPHHDGNFSTFAGGHVSGNQQGGGWSTKMVELRRNLFSALGTGKVHPRSFYRQVPGQKSRQNEEFCLRLSSQPDCRGLLFRSDSVSARFWHRYDHLFDHFYNALCCRNEEKVLVSFCAGADPLHSLGNHGRGIPHPQDHRISRPLERPNERRVSSHPVFLRFWPGRVLGNRAGGQPSKTFLSPRSAHGFYFFSPRGRTGIYGNNGDCPSIFNFDLEGVCHRLPSQRPVWSSFGNRFDSFDRVPGFYQSGSGRGASSNQGVDPSLHQYGWVINDNHHAFSGSSAEYFRANSTTMIQCKNELL